MSYHAYATTVVTGTMVNTQACEYSATTAVDGTKKHLSFSARKLCAPDSARAAVGLSLRRLKLVFICRRPTVGYRPSSVGGRLIPSKAPSVSQDNSNLTSELLAMV
ncbi:hypothetical protein EVAR_5581_1 [Eumeta japonica]|uniref:Uncharacterized protein n=1 Tax=Eumeta variegata TaxID=151549 RepID=A0A4C1U1D2_EUMVA|nr:hypothetical protein EVAR_5581_1 [Eumeta japonica]